MWRLWGTLEDTLKDLACQAEIEEGQVYVADSENNRIAAFGKLPTVIRRSRRSE